MKEKKLIATKAEQEQDDDSTDHDEAASTTSSNYKKSKHPDIKMANLKRKKYKLNSGSSSKQKDESEIAKMNSTPSNQQPEQYHVKHTTKNDFLYRIENIIDLNSKFKLKEFETIFVRSYTSITRFIFLKYLLYLIIFYSCWLIYFLFDNGHSALLLSGHVDNYLIKNDSAFYSFVLNQTAEHPHYQQSPLSESIQLSEIVFGDNIDTSDYKSVLVYLVLILVFFIVVFLVLTVAEFKEAQYRLLKKRLHKQETNAKVDKESAERDLKIAMEQVISKEKECLELQNKINAQSESISRMQAIYLKLAYPLAMFVALSLFALCFLGFIYFPTSSNQIGQFVWFFQAVVLIYVLYPFHMLITLVLAIGFSVLFEVFELIKDSPFLYSTTTASKMPSFERSSDIVIVVFIKILFHSGVHLMGMYLKHSLQSIKRETFIKVAHMHKEQMTAQQDTEITERMIRSIMPPLFTHVFGKPEEFKKSVNCVHQMRPLFIYPINEISILFADIVGFTKMSSNKTAEELVFLLNDLYGRFDKLCEKSGCEKISTLGDCYYCVSGCLNGRADHAKCCVEMGLAMIKEIEQFNSDHNVDVNMRVGVHTGNALCGFIGGKRFRFDVWSGDVTLANKMESSGQAGWVHISEDTFKRLDNKFNTKPGEKYSGKATYFVMNGNKRETVAEAMKQSSFESTSPVSLSGEKASYKIELLNRPITETNTPASFEDVNIIRSDYMNSEDNSLLKAVDKVHFFQPDVNILTMRFKEEREEQKFHAYLMNFHKESPLEDAEASASSSYVEKSFATRTIWTNKKNSFYFSIFVSFLINIFVSFAHLLTFIEASTGLDHETSSYKISMYRTLIEFTILILAQLIFLVAFYFIFIRLKGLIHDLNMFRADEATNGAMMNGASGMYGMMANAKHKKQRRTVMLSYLTLNAVSIVFLSLMPFFIMFTTFPSLVSLNKSSFDEIFNSNDWSLDNLNSSSNSSASSKQIDIDHKLNSFSVYVYFAFTVSLINFCSFIQLNSLLKTLMAFIFALVLGVVGLIGIGDNFNNFNEASVISQIDRNQTGEYLKSVVTFGFSSTLFVSGFMGENAVFILSMFLLVILIWFINQHSELIQRLSYKYDQDALHKVTNAREQKELANWLIDVVLPAHVVDHVKEKKQYSRNYDCVGVLFVSLCNFGEFFEESYEKGRQFLRVLNEITVDFDRMFDEPKYKNIEKIKSIGSTIMIASGLHPDADNDPSNSHLHELMEFALELFEKLEAFNNEAMSVCHFKFQMRMGLNFGPVTAGVIGTERLLYDIWGNTVNVASRMDSTGQAGFLQVPKECTSFFGKTYKFTDRGLIQIKGKGEMQTCTMNPYEYLKKN
jgi:class 3 adenylate cyclase